MRAEVRHAERMRRPRHSRGRRFLMKFTIFRSIEAVWRRLVDEIEPIVVEEVGGRRPVHLDAARVVEVVEGFFDGQPFFDVALVFFFQRVAVVLHVPEDEHFGMSQIGDDRGARHVRGGEHCEAGGVSSVALARGWGGGGGVGSFRLRYFSCSAKVV